MGCNCKKNREKERLAEREKKLLAGSIETVSLPVLSARKKACRNCPHSTKNPHIKYAAFGGITNQSSCKLSSRTLVSALKDPLYQCPDKRF